MATHPWGIALPKAGPRGIAASGGLTLLLMAMAVLLSACEYPGVPHPLAAQAEGVAPASAAPLPTAPSSSPPGAVAANPGSGAENPPLPLEGKAQVALKDFRLDPDKVIVKAGTVTFVLKNEGRYTHDFRVEGQGVDDRAPKVGQGRTFEWQIALTPGSYGISCPISNHADRGMKGTLQVMP